MYDTMDMLKFIIDINKCTTVCFLCLKNKNKTVNIYSKHEIKGDCFDINLCLAEMVQTILPLHEILFNQACEDCMNLILKMFIALHKYKYNIMMLKNHIDNFNKQLQKINLIDVEKVFIRMDGVETELQRKPKSVLADNVITKSFDCDKCDMKFSSKEMIEKHKKTLHKNSYKSTICDVCGQMFKNSNSLKAHTNCHRQKECPYCFKFLKTHSYFNVHLKSHRTQLKRKPNRIYLQCNSCDYKTLNKKTLEAHMNKLHLQIRPYICKVCLKGFYKKSNLTEHYNTHTQTKNKTCEICGDNFVNDKTLTEHLRLHTGSKPYECNLCYKKFVTSGRRSDHVKRTHMEKSECCLYCDKKFSMRKELNRHVRKSHAGNISKITNDVEDNNSNSQFVDCLVLPLT